MKSIEGIGDVFGAVAGLSMGGLGAMLYAAHSPHLFRAAASFSGVLDTLSTTDWQFPPEAWGNRTQQAKVWRQHNPTDRAADLRGISLFVSYGNGDPGPLDAAKTATSGVGGQIERRLTPGNAAFVRRLAKLGIPAGSTRTGPASTTGRTGNGNCTVRCPASCVPTALISVSGMGRSTATTKPAIARPGRRQRLPRRFEPTRTTAMRRPLRPRRYHQRCPIRRPP